MYVAVKGVIRTTVKYLAIFEARKEIIGTNYILGRRKGHCGKLVSHNKRQPSFVLDV